MIENELEHAKKTEKIEFGVNRRLIFFKLFTLDGCWIITLCCF